MKSLFDKTHRSALSTRTVGLSVVCLLGITAVGLGYDVSRANVPNGKSPAKLAVKLSQAEIDQSVGKLPLAFEPNQGQTDPQVKYIARAQGYTAFLTGNQTVLWVKGTASGVLTMTLPNANAASRMVAADPQVGKSNYLIGNDRSKWLTNVPHFGQVRYQDVYPGVDVVYSGNQRNLEYDFVVKPGADPNQIRMAYTGSSRFELNAQGDLELQTAAGMTVAHKPLVYQTIHGQRASVQGEYVLTANNQVGFKLGAYDASQPVVIDPTVTVLTFVGGNFSDTGLAVASNSTGVYLTGETFSAADYNPINVGGFPVTPPTCSGGSSGTNGCASNTGTLATFATSGAYSGGINSAAGDAYVTKLTIDGKTLVYSTFVGGTGEDIGKAIAVDSTGVAYITGSSNSVNFPVTVGSNAGGYDLFYARLAANGQSLPFATYFGGSGADSGNAISVDAASGNVYIGGTTASSGILMTAPLAVTASPATCTATSSNCSSAFTGATFQGGATDGLVLKYNSSNALMFSTYLGGSGADSINGIFGDASGNIYVAGTTGSVTVAAMNAVGRFPTTKSGSGVTSGTISNTMASAATTGTVGFATKINANLTSIGYSDTFGSGAETANAIAVDLAGQAYITGQTTNGSGIVSSITLTSGGSGYSAIPTVIITGSNSTPATASATIGTQALGTVTVGTPAVATAAAGTQATATAAAGIRATATATAGVQATATTTVVGAVVTGFVVNNPGGGYATAPTVTVLQGACNTLPTGSATINGAGQVTSITVTANGTSTCTTSSTVSLSAPDGISGVTLTNGGTGYTAAPTVTFTGGPCATAEPTATATIAAGAVTGITVNTVGLGCTGAPSMALTAPGITGVTLTNGGTGYGAAPLVAFAGCGTAPTATAVYNATTGVVTGITLTSGGVCLAAPTVTLDTPGITGVTVGTAGTGYFTVPTVGFTGCGTAPTATAAINGTTGVITGITVNTVGVCATAPTVTITAPGVVSAMLTNAGSGYNAAPSVIGVAGCTSFPTLSVGYGGGVVTGISLTTNGAGCVAPTFGLTAPGVTGITVTGGGAGYGAAPAITFSAGSATATASLGAAGGLTLTTGVPTAPLTSTQLGQTATTPATGTVNGALAVGSQGYVLALPAAAANASYLTYLETATPSAATTLTGIALDDVAQAYVIGTQALTSTANSVYVARLNPTGPVTAIGSAPTPGGVNFNATIAGTPGTATNIGNGIAVSVASGIRTAFLIGTSTASSALTPSAITGSFSTSPIQNYLLNGSASTTLTTPKLPNGGGTSQGGGDLLFSAMTFQDIVVAPSPVTFSTTVTSGAGTNQTMVVTVTGAGGTAVPCAMSLNTTGATNGGFGAFFTNAAGGSVTPVTGSTSSFTVATGLQIVPTVTTPITGVFQVVPAGGCPLVEPVTVAVTYSSSTTYPAPTVTPSGGLTMTTPIGSTSGLLPATSGVATLAVTSASVAGVPTTVTATIPSNWTTAASGVSGTCLTSGPISITGGATGSPSTTITQTVTATVNLSCFNGSPGAITTAGTYSGNISIASTTPGQAPTVLVPYTITVTPALQLVPPGASGTLTYQFAAGATAPQQQTVTIQATGAAATYSTTIGTGGTGTAFPTGALSVVGGATGTIPSGGTASVVVQVTPPSTAGTYSGIVTISSGAQSYVITVTAYVSNALVPTFTSSVGGSARLVSGALNISLPAGLASTAIGTLTLGSVNSVAAQAGASVITFSSGTGWLTDGNTAACANVNTGGCNTHVLSVLTNGLAAGTYNGNIAFSSTTSGVAALNVPVVLTVTSGSSFLQNGITTPANLVFTTLPNETAPYVGVVGCSGTAGGAGTCTVSLQTNGGTVNNVTITPATTSGGAWFTVNGLTTPIVGQTINNTPTILTIVANSTNLAPRTYIGSITVSAAGANGSLVIPVSMVVLPLNPFSVGIYRSGLWLLDSNFNHVFDGGDIVTAFGGLPGDIPVVGDWNGDGRSKIGIYRGGTWLLDYNGNGVWDTPGGGDRQYQFGGLPGDIPVVGDWNGTGFSKIGIFRSGYYWILDTTGAGTFIAAGTGVTNASTTFAFGGTQGCTAPPPGMYATLLPAGFCDIPVVGDWDSDGTTKVGVVRAAGSSPNFLWILDTFGQKAFIAAGTGVTNASTVFAFGGIQGDLPVVGDWTNNGASKVGVFRYGYFWVLDTTANLPTPTAAGDTLLAFPYGGIAGDMPVAGRWR